MSDWNRGTQPSCSTHRFVYHSCCHECRKLHGRENDRGLVCKACSKKKQ